MHLLFLFFFMFLSFPSLGMIIECDFNEYFFGENKTVSIKVVQEIQPAAEFSEVTYNHSFFEITQKSKTVSFYVDEESDWKVEIFEKNNLLEKYSNLKGSSDPLTLKFLGTHTLKFWTVLEEM